MDIADALYKLEDKYRYLVCQVSKLTNFEAYSFLSDCIWSDLHTRKSLQSAFYYIDKYRIRDELLWCFGSVKRKIRKVRSKIENQIYSDEFNDFRRGLYIAVFLEYPDYFLKHSLFFFVNEYGRK